MRDKCEFRAIRLRCGISHTYLARHVGCPVMVARKWDDPNSRSYPPDEAWDIIDEALERQQNWVRQMVDLVTSSEQSTYGDENVYGITTWGSERSYLEAAWRSGIDDPPGDWEQANADRLACAIALEALGYEVSYLDGDSPRY